MRLQNTFLITLVAASLLLGTRASAEPNLNFNFFSAVDAYDRAQATSLEHFRIGESALFVTGRLSDRWSVLSEITAELPDKREQPIRVERARLRYALNRDHWLSVGKMHTPVNYWNDTYHHGRIFFPTINRPLVFGGFIPMHEAGVRAAGQDLLGTDFGYDLVLGSGQSAGDDFFSEGIQSYTISVNWSPSNRLRLSASYYRDSILDHRNNSAHRRHHHHGQEEMLVTRHDVGAHAGTHPEPHDIPVGDIPYELLSFSAYREHGPVTMLTEVSANRTNGGDFNHALYQYLGYDLSEDLTGYILADHVHVQESEVHFEPGRDMRFGVGFEYSIGVAATLKVEVRRRQNLRTQAHRNYNELQAQLSIGL